MGKITRLTGVVLGASAIVLGAFGAHAFKEVLDAASMESYKTAVNYQIYHAFFLLLLGSLQANSKSANRAQLTSHHTKNQPVNGSIIYYLCVIGVLLFSGSIYFLLLNKHVVLIEQVKYIALITPVGGLLLILSWILLGVHLIKNKFD
jgi:uncharacterized membrane protein YgdD (TMEM256/DUF423 family)